MAEVKNKVVNEGNSELIDYEKIKKDSLIKSSINNALLSNGIGGMKYLGFAVDLRSNDSQILFDIWELFGDFPINSEYTLYFSGKGRCVLDDDYETYYDREYEKYPYHDIYMNEKSKHVVIHWHETEKVEVQRLVNKIKESKMLNVQSKKLLQGKNEEKEDVK